MVNISYEDRRVRQELVASLTWDCPSNTGYLVRLMHVELAPSQRRCETTLPDDTEVISVAGRNRNMPQGT